MNYNELKDRLYFGEKEDNMFIPNEIFEDLPKHIEKGIHIPFAYSYYYLITYLYRYAKYDKYLYTNEDIKEILGYNKSTKGLDYLIKRNGLLDEIGYTSSDKDFPIGWQYSKEEDELIFTMWSEFKEDYGMVKYPNMSRKYSIKVPEKALYRYIHEDGTFDGGTFYEIENTHNILPQVFLFCMSIDDIGCNGFYLYSYLKHKNDLFKQGYDISIEGLSKVTTLSNRTINRILDALKKHNLIRFQIRQEFVIGLDKDERRPIRYSTNEYHGFKVEPQGYIRTGKISLEEYRQKQEEGKKLHSKVDEGMDFLPQL